MLRPKNATRLAWTGLLALVLAATLPALAAADEPAQKIRIKKIVKECEGDDCDGETVRRVLFVGDGGEVRALSGDSSWLGDMDHRVIFAGAASGTFLGVALTDLTVELRQHFGVPEDAGVLISKVVDDSAAAAAGVLVGDILTAVDGEQVASSAQLMRAIGKREPGAVVELELWRDGSVRTASATLGERRGGHHRAHAVVVHCDEDDGDCGAMTLGDFDCGGADECELEVECDGGDCRCTVNGEATDCKSLPGFKVPGG